MRKRWSHKPALWLVFTIHVLLIFFFTAVIMIGISYFLVHINFFSQNANPLYPLIVLFLSSAIVGIFISLIVGHRRMKPVMLFSEATKEVAKGDFSVRINETSRVAELQELIQNFNIMVQELSSIETLRNDFVVSVSHEFKTPLAAIEGYATLLQDHGLTDSERAEYVQMIISSSRQLSTLTENILQLSRLENQEVLIDKCSFRLDEQIREAVLLLENKWTIKNLDMDIDLSKMKYYGSKNLLLQVWINLIDNAIKFSDTNGKIAIYSTQDDKQITVTIKDEGKGMNQAEMNHIFDKFYQGDNTRKESGNGLGLALVKRVIDLCKGDVHLESQNGVGSTFIITLPVITTYKNHL